MGSLAIVAVIALLLLVESDGMPLSGAAAGATTTQISIPKVYQS